MPITSELEAFCQQSATIARDLPRRRLIELAVERKEAVVSANGALATWTPPESTGRSPKDTVYVRRPSSEAQLDWDSPNNLPISEETFDLLLADALAALRASPTVFACERAVGADSRWALPVRLYCDRALHALFAYNMFRPLPGDLARSVFAGRPFTIYALPYHKLDERRYEGRLRRLPENGRTTTMAVAMDLDRRLGVIYGSAYCGSLKKMVFSVANYYLPAEGILPLHCSANEGAAGDTALLLGLSGTGKTTLSADPRRALLGDDEHGWSEHGIANFEYGCYAKLIDLSAAKEPEIHRAVFHPADYREHGAIIENAMLWPDGTFDLSDRRLTENSRVGFPLSFLSNVKEPPVGAHPRTILFLTADANGVLPPVARLDHEQAMLWFLMGYTSKLAGTECGVIEPTSTFSRFFGEPFMPRTPDAYARMLGEKLARHGTAVYLVNTGWSAGPYGVGQRMDISLTREIVHAALDGGLAEVEYDADPLFHFQVPRRCPGVTDPAILQPRSTWSDAAAFDARARKLAGEFAARFKKVYGSKGIAPAVARQCPGV